MEYPSISERSIHEFLATRDKLHSDNANETEVRSKLIDPILFDLLDWSRDDASLEEGVPRIDASMGFCDYVLKTSVTAVIVEAKRSSSNLEKLPNKSKFTISSLLAREIKKDIMQVKDYCQNRNIPFAVLTNGNSWLVFPVVRIDNVSFTDSSALFFNSLDYALGPGWKNFYRLLSRPGVVNGELELELLGSEVDQIEERRLKQFVKRTQRSSNELFPLIENEVNQAFSDVVIGSSAELLSHCYVATEERVRFDNQIRMHLDKPDKLFNSKVKRPLRSKEQNSFVQKVDGVDINSPIAILLLGTVGAGKTTFIEYTRRVQGRDLFENEANRIHWIYLDFRDNAPDENSLDFINRKIYQYIEESEFLSDWDRSIRPAFKETIDSLYRGPLKLLSEEEQNRKISELVFKEMEDKASYIRKILANAARNSAIFLVIDNVDQFESEDNQSEIFSNGVAIAKECKLSLVLSMRESTFVKQRNSAIFNAFDCDNFHIGAPPVTEVLSKRFNYLERLLKDKPGELITAGNARVHAEDLSVFVRMLRSSVLGSNVGRSIEVLANRDIRLALKLTREFLVRGYTDPGKALSIYKTSGSYRLPAHEAFRTLLQGNNSFYSEETSNIGNPFDSRLGKTSAQLLRFYVLSMLVKLHSESVSQSADYSSILSDLRLLGFSTEHVKKILYDLWKLRFCQTSSHTEPADGSSIFPTRLGGYVVRNLIADFTFMETVMMDTFIASSEVWKELKALSADVKAEQDVAKSIYKRSKKVRIFYEYLSSLYEDILSEAKRRGLAPVWLTNPFAEMKYQAKENRVKAILSARKNYR